MTDWPIQIVVYGKASTAGSKKGFVHPTTGRVVIVDDAKKSRPWKNHVADVAMEQYDGPLLTVALDVEMIFVMTRLKSHYGTGKNAEVLKDTAPLQPTVMPDVLKLARAVEDALTGVLWRDDALIVNESLQKRYGDRERVEIRVRPTALTCVNDLIMMGQEKPHKPSELVPWEQLTLVA